MQPRGPLAVLRRQLIPKALSFPSTPINTHRLHQFETSGSWGDGAAQNRDQK
eukprot:TRINITY_DN64_c0_g1_i11.p4 TRINITY_DN64_c0_g1~~TRINITY_DN64_c0_g1_i11.p4  ORF type:complete len:52 (+),score=9.84 TRINITY_DN64_c0_g1_i11:445-600(+)